MISNIQLVVFGNFEKFSTQNAENYIELIRFWTERGFQPSSVNQMKMNANGLVETIIMPVFVKDTEASVEVLGDRINFKLANTNGTDSKERFIEIFKVDMYRKSMEFIDKFQIRGNRLALNCEETITCENITLGEELLPGFPNIEKTERLLCRKEIFDEVCNISRETCAVSEGNVIRSFFDYNTLFENSETRFSVENDRKIFDCFLEILCKMQQM